MDSAAARRIMVDSQIRPNDVTDPDIVAAFMSTPREAFVPRSKQAVAYGELEIETSPGRALWTPRDTAKLITAADPKPTDLALVIGAGAGYEAALLSGLVDTVIALEDDDDVVESLTERFTSLDIDDAVAVAGPIEAGLKEQGPFDLILVCGMVQTLPSAWTEQLAEGGRMTVVMELDRDLGRGRVFTRAGDTVSAADVFDARPPKFTAFDKPPAFQF
ncbi:MAG: protein-L-isoaspartate O-methyltransferase [Pseudomonadota bacterium]